MKVVIVYSSRYGNGKKCVDCVDSRFKAKGHSVEVLVAAQADPAQVPPADLYVFSGASEAFSLAKPIKAYLKGLPELVGRKYALINTHGMKKARGLPKMEKILTGKKKMVKVGVIDFQVGKGSDQGNGLPAGYEARLSEWADRFG
jgi:flavodoxin